MLRPDLHLDSYLSNPKFNLEFRRHEYQSRPYLESLNQVDLDNRYLFLRRNLLTLVGPERDEHPIESFLSSWYWLRKYIHTEAEYGRRIRTPPDFICPFALRLLSVDFPFRQQFSSARELIVRYGHMSWLPNMLTKGRIRIKLASKYEGETLNDAQRDDELRHHSFQSGQNSRVIDCNGTPLRIIGDIRTTVELIRDYYILCASTEYDPTIAHGFGYDGCLVIHNIDEFALRLRNTFDPMMRGRIFAHFPVQYVDPYEMRTNEIDMPGAVKSISYAYQKEYRFAWSPSSDTNPPPEVELDIGDLRDIAEVYPLEDLLKDHDSI